MGSVVVLAACGRSGQHRNLHHLLRGTAVILTAEVKRDCVAMAKSESIDGLRQKATRIIATTTDEGVNDAIRGDRTINRCFAQIDDGAIHMPTSYGGFRDATRDGGCLCF